jgi:hypothetical protein
MSIDFTLMPKQPRLRADVRAFARDVLSKVRSAAKDLPTPLARFTLPDHPANRPSQQASCAA